MPVIRVKDYIDQIVEQCFNQDIKDLLEFSLFNNRVSVKDQFLHYYEQAKYQGDLTSLIRSIKIRIQRNEPLVMQLKDQNTNIQRLLELGEYSKVTTRYLETLGTESSVGASASSSNSQNKQADTYSGIEQNDNLNISDEQTAVAQTNAVELLEVQLPQPTLAAEQNSKSYLKYSIRDGNLNETPTSYSTKKLNKPQQEEKDPFGYQNFTKDLNTNESNTTTATNTSRGSDSSTTSNAKTATSNVKGARSDESERSVEFITNDARFKLWSREVPRLKTKFWNSFYTLFCGFEYYEC